MPVFDLVIPLGFNCVSASQVRCRNLRLASFPFDWISTGSHPHPMELPLRSFETRFAHWLQADQLDGERYAFYGRTDLHVPVYDGGSGYLFFHDFVDAHPSAAMVAEVSAKYTRRIERMYRMIEASESILFVLFGEDAALPMETLQDALRRLERCFPKARLLLYTFTCNAPMDVFPEETGVSGVVLQRSMVGQNGYMLHFQDWAARWLDRVQLSGKFEMGAQNDIKTTRMSWMEKLHWKCFKHCRKYLIKRNRLGAYFR